MAEIEFSVFSRQCLARRIGDEDTLKREIAALEAQRNNAQATIDCDSPPWTPESSLSVSIPQFQLDEVLEQDTGPYFYLPKLQSYQEARLWNDIFVFSEDSLDLPQGAISPTVLIEHILAAFEMEEILHAFRDRPCSLNLGRWDYIFSYIKTFPQRSASVFPDRAQVTMATTFSGRRRSCWSRPVTREGLTPWVVCLLTYRGGTIYKPTKRPWTR